MATLVGRKQEQKELQRLYQSGEAELVVIYGRRRVGKTYLVNQIFEKDGFVFKVTGLHKQKRQVQLDNFVSALKEYSGKDDRKTSVTWSEAFGELKQSLHKGRFWLRRALLDSYA